jgi:hypothetical protein
LTTTRCYSELIRISSFEGRYEYLALRGQVGDPTFGFDRYINQLFYRSRQWRNARDDVISRDRGCDLGVVGFEIYDRIIIHHMNPMTIHDIVDGDDSVLDPEFLICVSHQTHNAIHYGDKKQIRKKFVERRPGDTRLWNRRNL